MSTEASAQSSLPMAMSAPLGVRVRAQGYVFSRRDALEFGTSDEQLRAWHASGEVQRGSHGVYFVPGAKRASTTTDDETSRRRLRATLLALGEGYFATHQSALLAWGIPASSDCDTGEVHVGRSGDRRWSRRPGVRLHRVSSRADVVAVQESELSVRLWRSPRSG